MNIYFQGSWRMDWGLGNPNKTAVLIALVMLLSWALAFVWKHGFWVALTLTVGFAWCLVQTYSRGGMVAAAVGFGILIATAPRPWPRPRWIAVLVSFWILGGFVLYSKAQLRYEQGLFTEDQSIGNRLIIWKHVPEMMWAAPWGWGLGKAGDSYTEWYQPFNQPVGYLNLINSHFTWMVELGWIGSVFYIFAWLAVLRLSIPNPKSILGWLPSSIWIALAVGSSFSAVAESPWLWILPTIVFIWSISERFFMKKWPRVSYLLANAGASLGTLIVLLIIGRLTTSLPIVRTGDTVELKGDNRRTFILLDRHVLGPLFGHTFRRYIEDLDGRTWVFVEPGISPPKTINTDDVWLEGKLSWPVNAVHDAFQNCHHIVLINPDFFPDDLSLTSVESRKTAVYIGEYCQMPSRYAWSHSGLNSVQIHAAGDFIPDWPISIINGTR